MIYKDFIPILDLIKCSIKLRLLTNEVAALKDLWLSGINLIELN